MGLFKQAWQCNFKEKDSRDKRQKLLKKALNQVAKAESEAKLARIALEAPLTTVRGAAIKRLDDQAVLARLALTENDMLVRGEAIRQLTDQVALVQVAATDPYAPYRLLAAKAITNDAVADQVFHAIAKGKGESHVAKEAVGRISNPGLLLDIAQNAYYPDAAIAALESVSDQSVLAGIAKKDGDIYQYGKVATAAVARMTDPKLLTDVAQNAQICYARSAATEKLKALCSHEWDGCKCKICGEIRDEQHDIERITCKRCGRTLSGKALLEAVRNLTDQALLEKIASTGYDLRMCPHGFTDDVRMIAMEKVQNKSVLSIIANAGSGFMNGRYVGSNSYSIRIAAAMKTGDSALVERLKQDSASYAQQYDADMRSGM